jgi:3-hydroxyacyl-CoA dehydrogenase
VLLEERSLTPELLAEEIAGTLADSARRAAMSAAMRTFARPDAAARIVDRALALAGLPRRRSGVMAWLGRTRRVHFVGIGGIGMSGIAELLANLGYEVSGSDARRSDVTDRLAQLGVRVEIGHQAAHVGNADVVVVSSAIAAAKPGGRRGARRHVPVIRAPKCSPS